MLESEESRQNPSRSFCARRKWRGRNICKKSRKGVREECENSREFHREEERGWCFFGEIEWKYQLSLWEPVMWGTPIVPCVCYWDGKGFVAGFMRAVSKNNFSSVKYGKFIWPQAKSSWSFTRATKRKEKCCADPCCDWDTFGPRWKCSFKLWMSQRCGASSWSYHELPLHCFFLGFPKLHVGVWFFFTFF